MQTLLTWEGDGAWQAESALVELSGDRLTAHGTQLAVDPLPYRLDYTVTTGADLVTERLLVTVRGAGWDRRLDLRRDAAGWTVETTATGSPPLPDPGGDPATFADAVDCDLGRCPLTNVMPVRRAGLHRRPGAGDFVMALVAVPELVVTRSPQRYTHVRRLDDGGAVVGFACGDFRTELTLDGEGFVTAYPGLVRRVPGGQAGAAL